MPVNPASSMNDAGFLPISIGTPPRSAIPSILGAGIVHACSMTGGDTMPPNLRLRGELGVEVDRVHVVECIGPVPDHRLVDRIRRNGRLAGPAGGLADERVELLAEFGLVSLRISCHLASPFWSARRSRGARGMKSPAIAMMSR